MQHFKSGMTKISAGNYVVYHAGYEVQAVLETTAYGDRGWNAYLFRREVVDGVEHIEQGVVTDYPRYTRDEAFAAGRATVDARIKAREAYRIAFAQEAR